MEENALDYIPDEKIVQAMEKKIKTWFDYTFQFKLIMAGLEKFTLRIAPSSVYFFRFILEGYDNMFMLSTLDQRAGLVEVQAARGSVKDLLLILRSLRSVIGLDRMDSRCNAWIMDQLRD